MLKRVAIFSSEINERTKRVINHIVGSFSGKGIRIYFYDKTGQYNGFPEKDSIETFLNTADLPEKPELIMSIGGDGTFLETMMMVKDLQVPVAGINTGRLGFLANISENEVCQSLEMLYNNDFDIIERSLLEITEPAGKFGVYDPVALNEVTIQKSGLNMITITVYVDEVYLNTYWADGLIISTATGSTAYNLSAGGPILPPGDESIIISPLSAHNLTVRPIVLPGHSKLRMFVEGRNNEYLVTCDFRVEKLLSGQQIQIKRSDKKLKTVMLKGRDFYSTLRDKLMWGADKRN